MKHVRFHSILSLFLMAFVIVSCSKKDEPEPSIGDQVSGDFTITKIGIGAALIDVPYTDPSTGSIISGKIKITKVSDESVDATLTLSEKDKAGKVTDEVTELGTATLKKSSSGEIEAYDGTTKVGTFSNGTLTLAAVDDDFGNITITGKKN